MTAYPNDFCSSAAIARAMMSVVPPAGNGTTILIGFDGYCANADSAMLDKATAIHLFATFFMIFPLKIFLRTGYR